MRVSDADCAPGTLAGAGVFNNRELRVFIEVTGPRPTSVKTALHISDEFADASVISFTPHPLLDVIFVVD